mmetsp:Transcript_68026/g.107956  ORF Transcript_68026/g.107956 Transcript_68026/m.107956 type:complete len:219 (+) Transcript_68026:1105-1761(+)
MVEIDGSHMMQALIATVIAEPTLVRQTQFVILDRLQIVLTHCLLFVFVVAFSSFFIISVKFLFLTQTQTQTLCRWLLLLFAVLFAALFVAKRNLHGDMLVNQHLIVCDQLEYLQRFIKVILLEIKETADFLHIASARHSNLELFAAQKLVASLKLLLGHQTVDVVIGDLFCWHCNLMFIHHQSLQMQQLFVYIGYRSNIAEILKLIAVFQLMLIVRAR